MNDRFEKRREKFLRRLKPTGADALLAAGTTNVSWLTGFSGDSTWLLLGPDVCLLISDGRYATQIAEECPGLEAVIRKPAQQLTTAAVQVIERSGLPRLAFESDQMSFATVEALAADLKTCELLPCPGLVEELRAVKDPDEIAEIRRAVQMADAAFTALKKLVRRDMSELDLAHALEACLRREGARGASFETIVAADDRSALAHYRPSRNPIGDAAWLLVDWGADAVTRYKSDLTRLMVLGKPSRKLEKIYDIVLQAQTLAISAVRPGVTCAEIDRVARQHIADCGYGPKFSHSLGHGIGLDIHEQPRLAPNSKTVLTSGMIVTIEPGIYLPGWGGVRIEDDVRVTRDGCEVLSRGTPKDFESTLVDA